MLLVNNVQHFWYLLGYQKKIFKEQDPANIKAAELMGQAGRNWIHRTPFRSVFGAYFVSTFCRIHFHFLKQQFQEFIEQRTKPIKLSVWRYQKKELS